MNTNPDAISIFLVEIDLIVNKHIKPVHNISKYLPNRNYASIFVNLIMPSRGPIANVN